jgi:NAD(P)-dependent dehydrogenase (short-subunit alcohol dehydrogenase family)/acyl carrier protein
VARLTHLPVGQPTNRAGQPPLVTRQATYLITGALGAIGREMARWLVQQGACHLALLGRSGASPGDEPFLEELRQAGVTAVVYAVDVADREGVTAVWSEITAHQPPIKGIFHAAGVAADGTIAQIEWPRFAENLAAKINGAWNLHQLTADQPLDYFVLFSSGAAVLGSPGQSGYAAANAFMDGLAHYRRQRQLPALSVNWGPWAIGMASAVGQEGQQRWQSQGMGSLSSDQALAALAWLLPRPEAQVAVLPLQAVPSDSIVAENLRERPLLRHLTGQLIQPAPAVPANGHAPESFTKKLAQVPARRRKEMIVDYLRSQLGQFMGWDADYEIDPQQGLFDVGLDSLMAMELKGKLEQHWQLARPLPFTLIFDYPTLDNLANYLHTEMAGAENTATPHIDDGLESLSEEELLDLLAQEMDEK